MQIDSIYAFENFAISYDTKKNPFYKMPIASVDRNSPYYHMELFNDEMVFEKNNPIDINQFSGTTNSHSKFYYEYKANGYPSVMRVFDQNDPTLFYKVLYFYTQL